MSRTKAERKRKDDEKVRCGGKVISKTDNDENRTIKILKKILQKKYNIGAEKFHSRSRIRALTSQKMEDKHFVKI